jgi:hypothetical protein
VVLLLSSSSGSSSCIHITWKHWCELLLLLLLLNHDGSCGIALQVCCCWCRLWLRSSNGSSSNSRSIRSTCKRCCWLLLLLRQERSCDSTL